jgi:hypothetical protein
LAKNKGDFDAMTITQEKESTLLDPDDLDAGSPEYFTEAFRLSNPLLQNALLDPTDIGQVENYLESLATADPTFKYRRDTNAMGDVTGYIWQTGVMRRDFELYGSALFLDRLGRPLNSQSWPLMTVAMLSGEKKVCIPCEAIAVAERVQCYAWMIRATVEMTPGFQLTDIRVIFGDGILGGGTLLQQLGIADTCQLCWTTIIYSAEILELGLKSLV